MLAGRGGAVLASAAVTLAAAGCGNNPYPPGMSARPIIFRTLAAEPRSLDPGFAFTIGESLVIDQIYSSYFKHHYLKRPPTLELCLGARQPERRRITVADGGQLRRGEEWAFTLKKGVRFQDDPCFPGGRGREVTAADLAYAFQRMADPAVKSPIVGFVADKVIGFPKAIAAARAAGGFDYSRPIEGVQVDPHDPYTLRIRLNQPYPQLRYLMAMHFTAPVPREAVERYGDEFKRHPVGTGSYRLTELVRKQRIVLTANPTRHLETYPTDGAPGDREAGLLADAGKPLPLAEQIVFNIQKETITGWNLFQQGYLDSWNVTPESFRQVISQQGSLTEEMKRRGVRLSVVPDTGTVYYAINMKDPLLGGYTPQKRKLRQALSLAVNSQEYIDLFTQGYGIPAQTFVPPGLTGYDEAYRNPYRQFEPRLVQARRLLAEAGYPEGIDPATGERLTIYYDTAAADSGDRQEVALLEKQLRKLGVRMETRIWRDIALQDRLDHGQYQMVAASWYADYPDPENFWLLLYSPNARPGPNLSGYASADYDRLFERMRAMDDGPERLELLRRIRSLVEKDCPVIPRLHTVTLMLSYDWHTNVKAHPVSNDWLRYRGINAAERARRQREWNQPVYWPALFAATMAGMLALPAAHAVRQRRRRKLRRTGSAARSPLPGSDV